MSQFWGDFLRFALASTALLGALTWLVNAIVTHWLSKDLDTHKARLEAATAVELERLRADLAAIVKEREIRFGALHARRVAGIVELFEALQKSFGQVATIAGSIGCGSRPIRKFVLRLDETDKAIELSRSNVLFLEKGLADSVLAYTSEIRDVFTPHLKSRPADEPIDEDEAAALVSSFANMRVGLRDRLFGSIEREFRQLLGSELSPPSQPATQG